MEETSISDCLYLIEDAPINEFSLVKTINTANIVVLRIQDIIDSNEITLKKQSLNIPLFNLYFMESLSILSVYVFYIPICEVSVTKFYTKLLLPSSADKTLFKNVKLILQDNHITVYHSDDGACLISLNGLKRVIRPMMVRKSEKNQFEESANDKSKSHY